MVRFWPISVPQLQFNPGRYYKLLHCQANGHTSLYIDMYYALDKLALGCGLLEIMYDHGCTLSILVNDQIVIRLLTGL